MACRTACTIDPKWQVAFAWDDPDVWLNGLRYRGEPKRMRRDQLLLRATFNTERAALPGFCIIYAWIIANKMKNVVPTKLREV